MKLEFFNRTPEKVRERFARELERIAEEVPGKPKAGTQWMEFQIDEDSHSPVVLFHYPSNEPADSHTFVAQ